MIPIIVTGKPWCEEAQSWYFMGNSDSLRQSVIPCLKLYRSGSPSVHRHSDLSLPPKLLTSSCSGWHSMAPRQEILTGSLSARNKILILILNLSWILIHQQRDCINLSRKVMQIYVVKLHSAWALEASFYKLLFMIRMLFFIKIALLSSFIQCFINYLLYFSF